MAQIAYRGNLSAKSFPFLSKNFGRTVIYPQYDNNFNRQLQSSEDDDKDVGIPQAYYCHNVMPFAQGYQSIGYTQVIPAQGVDVDFSEIHILRDDRNHKVYMAVTNAGKVYVSNGLVWNFKFSVPAASFVTTAHVSGITYVYIEGTGCYRYNFSTSAFVSVTLTGLDVADTMGIVAASGYLVAWDSTEVAWSSTIDPTDFTPSLVTGAGSGSVEGAKGPITFCKAHSLGFIVYTSGNAVAALASGNSRYPFNFREIVGSGGVSSPTLLGYDTFTGNQYVYTTSGLQLISSSQCQTIFPDITDFISGKLFEDYDEGTGVFQEVVLSTTMQKKLNIIANRYLIISYGTTSLTHALIYDLSLKRYGKVKIPHVDTIEYQLLDPEITEIPKQSIGFLQTDGTLKVVNFSVYSGNSSGVIMFGKFQFVRARTLAIDLIELENIPDTTAFNLTLLTSYDGKNTIPSATAALPSTGEQVVYGCRADGINHSLLCVGKFALNSLVLHYHLGGKR